MLLDCINFNYHNLKQQTLNELDFEILSYLENKGYSLEVRGIYLFKEMIMLIMENLLNSTDEEKDILQENINNPYSQFYLDLARNKNDIGINTYNEYIRQAINLNKDEVTGLKAYQIALDILQNKGLYLEPEQLTRKLEK